MNNNEWFQNFQIQKVYASVPKSVVWWGLIVPVLIGTIHVMVQYVVWYNNCRENRKYTTVMNHDSWYYTMMWWSFICFFADLREVMLNLYFSITQYKIIKWCIYGPSARHYYIWALYGAIISYLLNGDASFQWSFSWLSAWGSKESTTIPTTHPSLLGRVSSDGFYKR